MTTLKGKKRAKKHYSKPAIKAQEKIQTRAGFCDPGGGGKATDCSILQS